MDKGISAQDASDGEYTAKVGGYDCEATVDTKVSATDGVEETHIDYAPRIKSRWKFTTGGSDNYDKIDWTK